MLNSTVWRTDKTLKIRVITIITFPLNDSNKKVIITISLQKRFSSLSPLSALFEVRKLNYLRISQIFFPRTGHTMYASMYSPGGNRSNTNCHLDVRHIAIAWTRIISWRPLSWLDALYSFRYRLSCRTNGNGKPWDYDETWKDGGLPLRVRRILRV